MEFLYTGLIQDLTPQQVDMRLGLQRLATQVGDMNFLQDYLANIANGLEDLNPSIGTYLNDRTAERMRAQLLAQPVVPYHDVELVHAETGAVIRAHRAVIRARCDVLASRIDGGHLQIDVPLDIFRMLLEYIYTEHVFNMELLATTENLDTLLALLTASGSFALYRLVNLCELYLSKTIERATADSIQHCKLDLPAILNHATAARANQLVDFILHWLSTNYEAVSKRADIMATLSPAHLEHLEANRWPPLTYIQQVEQYERDYEEWQRSSGHSSKEKGCSIQ